MNTLMQQAAAKPAAAAARVPGAAAKPTAAIRCVSLAPRNLGSAQGNAAAAGASDAVSRLRLLATPWRGARRRRVQQPHLSISGLPARRAGSLPARAHLRSGSMRV